MTSCELHELCAKHAGRLRAFVGSHFGDSVQDGFLAPEDVVQATFERLLRKNAYANRNATDPGAEPGRAPRWLVNAVRYTAKTMRRGEWFRRRRQRRWVRKQVAAGVVGLGREYNVGEYVGHSVPGAAAHASAVVLTEGAHRADEIATKIDLARALARLREIDVVAAEAAVLVHHDGLTWAEVAKGLGTGKADALRMRVARAFEKLRDEQA